MGYAKPTRDEFDLSGNVVTHKPTGATWVKVSAAIAMPVEAQ
jgi:hypothetical protein